MAGPASWYLLGGSALDPSGLRWQANNGFHVDALLSETRACCLRCAALTAIRRAERRRRFARSWLDVGRRRTRSFIRTFVAADARCGPAFQGIGAGVGVPVLSLPERAYFGGLAIADFAVCARSLAFR